ncbi:MAG: GFA family protein [Tahibacter sp.]
MHIGSCFCGSVTYEVRGNIGPAYYCHCSRCRKISGSAFSSNAVVDVADFFITRGEDLLKATRSESGVARVFCSACGSSLFVRQENQMRLRLGTLDTPLAEGPAFHIYTNSKANWFALCDDLPQHEESVG